MSESTLPWGDDVFEYYYSEECEVACGIPVDDSTYFDPLAALTTIHLLLHHGEVEEARSKIQLLGQLFMATSMKRPDLVRQVELELTVQNFDNHLDRFLESLGVNDDESTGDDDD
jgi:hypothetical protein